MNATPTKVATTAAAVLLAFILIQWLLSYAGDTLFIDSHAGQVLITSVDGSRTWAADNHTRLPLPDFHRQIIAGIYQPPPTQHRFLGFYVAAGANSPAGLTNADAPNTFWILAVPYWFLAVAALAAFTAFAHRARRTSHRHAAGHCQQCGYDLRATPTRCPECSTIPPNENPARAPSSLQR